MNVSATASSAGPGLPVRRRVRRRSSGRRRRRAWARALILFSVALLGMLMVALAPRLPRPRALTDAGQIATTGSIESGSKAGAAVHRPVYPYSVVPGGVHSPDEVIAAMAADPVVAEHFAAVNPARLRLERLEAPMHAHVSYRVGDEVYWTKRQLTLRAGESVITDGQTTIRARCGNVISMEPLAPARDEEPVPPVFDVPIGIIALPAGSPLGDPPPAPPSFPPGPPHWPPPGLSPPPGGFPPQDPLPVPEPGTWALVGTGLALLLLRRRRRL